MEVKSTSFVIASIGHVVRKYFGVVWSVSDLIMLCRKIPHMANLLAIIGKMRDDAAGGALQCEADVIDKFKVQVCDEGHTMIKHVNV